MSILKAKRKKYLIINFIVVFTLYNLIYSGVVTLAKENLDTKLVTKESNIKPGDKIQLKKYNLVRDTEGIEHVDVITLDYVLNKREYEIKDNENKVLKGKTNKEFNSNISYSYDSILDDKDETSKDKEEGAINKNIKLSHNINNKEKETKIARIKELPKTGYFFSKLYIVIFGCLVIIYGLTIIFKKNNEL